MDCPHSSSMEAPRFEPGSSDSTVLSLLNQAQNQGVDGSDGEREPGIQIANHMAHGDMDCMGSIRENFVPDGATAAGFLGEPRCELMLVGEQGETEWCGVKTRCRE